MYYIRSGQQPKLNANQQVNRLGKYLFKHLDTANDIDYTPNTCEVHITVLYEIPRELYRKYQEHLNEEAGEIFELKIMLNFTTYQNKVRLNVIEDNENERTLGQRIYKPEDLMDLQASQNRVMNDVYKILSRKFEDYDFIV